MRKKQTDSGSSAAGKKSLFQKRQLQIVKKAAKLFMKKGYAQTSMRQISRATGIDISNLYYFIESKEDILFRVFEMIHRPESEIFHRQEIIGIEDPVERLRLVLREILNVAYKHKEEILLLYRESKLLPDKLRKQILIKESHFVTHIEEILKTGLEKRVFEFKDASFTANMIIFELSLYPLRSWNLRRHSKEELIDLVEAHIMKAVIAV